jgi:hypothetical protein
MFTHNFVAHPAPTGTTDFWVTLIFATQHDQKPTLNVFWRDWIDLPFSFPSLPRSHAESDSIQSGGPIMIRLPGKLFPLPAVAMLIASASFSESKPTIEALAWIGGCWEGTQQDRLVESIG